MHLRAYGDRKTMNRRSELGGQHQPRLEPIAFRVNATRLQRGDHSPILDDSPFISAASQRRLTNFFGTLAHFARSLRPRTAGRERKTKDEKRKTAEGHGCAGWRAPLPFFILRFTFFVKLPRVSETTASSVTCNHCGAPLAIQPSTRFVTCTHCGSRLEIHRSGAALFTEVLESIDQRTKEIAQDVDVIRRQNEVERLDREWAMRREALMVRTKSGTETPSIAGGIIGAVLGVGFGIFWIAMSSNAGAPASFRSSASSSSSSASSAASARSRKPRAIPTNNSVTNRRTPA